MDQNLLFVYVSLYSLIHYALCRHSLGLICGDGVGMGTCCRDGVGMETGVMGMGWGQRLWGWGGHGYSVHRDGVQFLSPCRPLPSNVCIATD